MPRILSIVARSIALSAAIAAHVLSLVCYSQLRYGYIADIGVAAAIIANASSIALSINKKHIVSHGIVVFGFAIDTVAWVLLSTAATLDFAVLFREMYRSKSYYVDDEEGDPANPMVASAIALFLFLA
jgi:hypothetical protein